MANGTWGPGGDVADIYRITIAWQYQQTQQQTGFFLRKGAALAATTQDVAQHVNTEFVPAFLGILSTDDRLVRVSARHLVDDSDFTIEPPNTTGAQALAITPTFLANTVVMKSSVRRRYGQGRMFWPQRNETWSTGDTLNDAGVAAFNVVLEELRTNYVGAGVGQQFILCNVHEALAANRPNKGNDPMPAVPASYYDVVSVRLNRNMTSLRSRKIGRGS